MAKKKVKAKRKEKPETVKPTAKKAKTEHELLDIDEAIAILGTSRPTFYRWLRSGQIKGQKLGRQWRFYREDLDRFVSGKQPKIELRTDISPLQKTLREKLADVGISDVTLKGDSEVETTCKIMTLLADKMNASDIHLDHFVTDYNNEASAFLRFRLNGQLHTVTEVDPRLVTPIVEQWKIWAACDPSKRFVPQSGTVMRFLVPELGTQLDMRVNFMPTRLGECFTARLLRPTEIMAKISIENLGFQEQELSLFKKWLDAPWGLIAVTGPSGCGKTTTIYNAIKYLSTPENKVVTVENPVEVSLPWTVQANVNPELGMDFLDGIKSALRSDPDVLYIGEFPDAASMKLGLQAAMTGHLVLTCLHAEDSVRALIRMKRALGDPTLISESVKLLISQRLMRKICPHCSTPHKLSKDDERKIQAAQQRFGFSGFELTGTFRKPVGCSKCADTGYIGRRAYYEFLEVSPEISEQLHGETTELQLQKTAIQQGMKPLLIRALELAAAGEASLSDALIAFGIR